MRNILIVLSGPSGVGKGTVAKILAEKHNNIALSVSYTTRAPRQGEREGIEYFFVSEKQFEDKIAENGFLEYSRHFENYYGTPKDFVLEKLKNHDVLLEIDVNGGLKVKENFKDAVLIMLAPPSIEEVRQRLKHRNTESDEKITLRIERIKYELEKQPLYDYVVVNDELDKAVEKIENIIASEKTDKGELL